MQLLQKIAFTLNRPAVQRRCSQAATVLFLSILVLGSLPGAREDIGRLASGAVLHSLAYAVLGALIFIGGKGQAWRRAVGAVLKVAVMGAMDECVQGLFPYRTAAIGDWMVDVFAGTMVSVILWKAWPQLLRHAAEPARA